VMVKAASVEWGCESGLTLGLPYLLCQQDYMKTI